MFVIEDEIHCEWCGQFKSFQEAFSELEKRSKVAWDSEPNRAPCKSWKQCGREYYLIEFDVTSEPWQEISRKLIFSISAQGIVVEDDYANNL